ncbi:hypothetical protein SDC9_96769 [bioreactor metagenome]|uniref:Uncharacterized protein n=1 Tax=bioreactor metagenome TaxID=1076179 RepID=A0A645A9Z3_9ZZZZ
MFVLLFPVYVPSSSSIMSPGLELFSAPLIPPVVVLLIELVAAKSVCVVVANKKTVKISRPKIKIFLSNFFE